MKNNIENQNMSARGPHCIILHEYRQEINYYVPIKVMYPLIRKRNPPLSRIHQKIQGHGILDNICILLIGNKNKMENRYNQFFEIPSKSSIKFSPCNKIE